MSQKRLAITLITTWDGFFATAISSLQKFWYVLIHIGGIWLAEMPIKFIGKKAKSFQLVVFQKFQRFVDPLGTTATRLGNDISELWCCGRVKFRAGVCQEGASPANTHKC